MRDGYGRSPIIEFEMRGIQHAIKRCIADTHIQQTEQMQAAVDAAIEGFDFNKEVSEAAYKVIGEEVEHYFKWGAGRDAIKEVVTDSINKLFKV